MSLRKSFSKIRVIDIISLVMLTFSIVGPVAAQTSGSVPDNHRIGLAVQLAPLLNDGQKQSPPLLGNPGQRTAATVQRATGGVATGNAIRGVVRAFEIATISAELNARIVRLPFRDGDPFKQGDVLVQFDCARLDAEVDAAAAAHQAHKLAHENQLRLSQYKAAGLSAVNQSRFEAEKAWAELNGLKAKRGTCTIAAPFTGRVIERSANAHEIAQPNQPLLKIVNDSRLELVLMVPSSWIGTLHAGTSFTFRIDETGKSYPATVTQIGGTIEPISQSVRLVGELVVQDASVLLGMSGTAILNVGEQAR